MIDLDFELNEKVVKISVLSRFTDNKGDTYNLGDKLADGRTVLDIHYEPETKTAVIRWGGDYYGTRHVYNNVNWVCYDSRYHPLKNEPVWGVYTDYKTEWFNQSDESQLITSFKQRNNPLRRVEKEGLNYFDAEKFLSSLVNDVSKTEITQRGIFLRNNF